MLQQEVDLLLEDFAIELTEAQLEFLIENRIEFIKNAHRDKLSTAHDIESSNLTSDKIIDHIANKIDPTTRKEHTQWLVNRYKSGDFKLSDSKDMKKLMSKFESAKGYLENKNLNDIKTVSQLKDNVAVTSSRVKSLEKESKENEVKPMPVVFENNEAKGYQVPNKSTSIKNYGPAGRMCKTSWCTASPNDNMFNGYGGGKYTLHLNNGSVLQLHHQSNQLKDEEDHEINLNDNPRYKDHKNTIQDFIIKTHELEGYPDSKLMNHVPLKSEQFQRLLDNHANIMSNPKTNRWSDDYKQSINNIDTSISTNADITNEQFEKLKHIPEFNSDYNAPSGSIIHEDKTHLLKTNKFAHPEHLDKLVDSAIESGMIRSSSYNDIGKTQELIKNTNISGDTHHKIISELLKADPATHRGVIHNYVSHAHNLQPEHFKRLEHIPDTKAYAVMNKSKTSILPEDFRYGTDEGYLTNVANRHDIDVSTAKHIIENATTKKPIYALVNNTNTPKEQLFEGLHSIKNDLTSDVDFHKIMTREDLNDSDVTNLVNRHMDGLHKTNYNGFPLRSTRLSREHIRSIINHPMFLKRGEGVIRNPKIKSDDLDLALDKDPENKLYVSDVLNSPALKSKHIDKLLEKRGMNDNFAKHLIDEDNDNPKYLSQVTPSHLHSVLDADVNMHFKHKVLHQPGVQVSHFEKVKNNPKFFGAITSSENAPPSILHSLATSPMDHIRQNVAENSNTELRTHQILKNDQNPEIAKISAKKVK